MVQADEDILFSDGDDTNDAVDTSPGWKILIVDDEDDVHHATVFALRNLQVLGRRLDFLHAHSAAEARQVLATEHDIAVALIDVVMEQVDAGLELVRHIRDDLGLQEIRLVLRTGQPGYAPEMDVVSHYDINDYRTKSELTRVRLFTTLTGAIRTYSQLHVISASRRGLDLIVRGSARLMGERGISDFAAGVITQITGLLGLPPEGLIITCRSDTGPVSPDTLRVVAAAGRYLGLLNQPLSQLTDGEARGMLLRSLESEESIFHGRRTVLLLSGRTGMLLAAYLDTVAPLSDTDRQLIDVFCANMAVCLDNLDLLAQLNASAFVDPQLRMPNRTRLVQEIDHRRQLPSSTDELLILLNLDNFSETNEALGHPYGDRILRAVADRLLEHCGLRVMVARVHGDTFSLFGPTALLNPDDIASLFREPFEIDSSDQMISASFGCVRLADVPGDGLETVKNASIALKRAKALGRGSCCYYDREMGTEVQERVRLLRNLRNAFQHDRLFLCYQPQIDLASGRTTGAEALLRWKTENGELIPPDRFISLAEYSGLIVDIGQWVLRNACHRQTSLAQAGFGGFRMAVNVSLAQFRHPRFLATLQEAITDTGIDPTCLELEITESMAMLEPDYITGVIRQIKALGVSVAVDDFGTGFSSLAYLQRLDVDRLKIDRAFVGTLESATGAAESIAQTVVQLGRNLGLTVIAEGVETPLQADLLRQMGCHEAQGFLFARPLESAALSAWLGARPTTH